jgi:hypothetical protein
LIQQRLNLRTRGAAATTNNVVFRILAIVVHVIVG